MLERIPKKILFILDHFTITHCIIKLKFISKKFKIRNIK